MPGLVGLQGTTLTNPGVGQVFVVSSGANYIAEGLQQSLNNTGASYTFTSVNPTTGAVVITSSDTPTPNVIAGTVIGQTANGLLINAGTVANPVFVVIETTPYPSEVYPQTFTPSQTFTPCFLAGTKVLTATGEVAVEDLRAGDLVPVLRNGGLSRVTWVGRSVLDCTLLNDPAQGWPVRVRAGAIADNAPHRDLWLSPQHAVLVDDVLIPVRHLINGHSVEQFKRDEVTYLHVELEQHEALMAEGLACESYLDTGNRAAFENGAVPDSSDAAIVATWTEHGCAPLVMDGPVLEAAWARIDARGRTQDSAVELPLAS